MRTLPQATNDLATSKCPEGLTSPLTSITGSSRMHTAAAGQADALVGSGQHVPVSSEVLTSLLVREFRGPSRHREFRRGSVPGSQFPP